ncbi:MAG: isoprenylcysteine carboxylmethyltransferase family protein [Candidatus Hydrogenedentes bacterium]|nr:isoprenylcysteine carboxylmethyltransferase family protein [Candidatus Hydrogenedentota bacterium]
MDKPYNFIYKKRGLLMLPPCFAILVGFYLNDSHNALFWAAGLALFAAGVLVRVWAQMHLHYRLRVRKNLTTTGPYRFVRNPIYIANTAMLLALTIISGLLWFLPFMLAWCAAVYTFVVRREEAHLAEKYGTPYRAFLESTPRWLPKWPESAGEHAEVRRYARSSVVAELHCLLWLLPFAAVELLTILN